MGSGCGYFSGLPLAFFRIIALLPCLAYIKERHRLAPEELLVRRALVAARSAGRARSMERLRTYPDPAIDNVRDIEAEMFHEQVMRHECVLAKLDFHRNPILHEVGLVV